MPPPQYITSRLQALQQKVDSTDAATLMAYPPLSRDECVLFGAFIQIYCYIELNLRRCVEVFSVAAMLSAKHAKSYPDLRPVDLVPAVKHAVGQMAPELENIAECHAKLDEIEARRDFRHLMAHWAARRVPDEDAILFLTKDDRDYREMHGGSAPTGMVGSVLMDLADLRGLALHISPYGEWIAAKTVNWSKRYPAQ